MIKYFRLSLPLPVFIGVFILQSVTVQAIAQTEPNVAEEGLGAETKIANSTDNENNIEMKSLLLSDSDIDSIRKARNYYERHLNGNNGIAEDDFLKNLEKIGNMDAESKTFTYPQFFLSSIAYRSAKDWVVWINDEKITQDSGISASGLKIIQIDNEKITVEWKPKKMDKITDPDSSLNDPVKVDFLNDKVTFTIKANQTFTSYAMRIMEGKVAPVTVDLDTDITAKVLESGMKVIENGRLVRNK
jgi:hypothetical protein